MKNYDEFMDAVKRAGLEGIVGRRGAMEQYVRRMSKYSEDVKAKFAEKPTTVLPGVGDALRYDNMFVSKKAVNNFANGHLPGGGLVLEVRLCI